MPAIDPTGDGLWFVYWNGAFEFDPSIACTNVGLPGLGNHGDNFDIYFAPLTAAGWQQPAAFEPAPSERFSAGLDTACLEQSVVCGCNSWADDQAWQPLRRSWMNRAGRLDYQPMFTAKGNLLFTTNRGRGLTVHLAVPFTDDFIDTGIFPALTWYDATDDHREGAGSLSADGRTFYFIRSTAPRTEDLCSFNLRVFRSRKIDEPPTSQH
jgi:hypothetical protein